MPGCYDSLCDCADAVGLALRPTPCGPGASVGSWWGGRLRRLRSDARASGASRNSLRAPSTRYAQTDAMSQSTKPARLRVGTPAPLRFSPPLKSPTPAPGPQGVSTSASHWGSTPSKSARRSCLSPSPAGGRQGWGPRDRHNDARYPPSRSPSPCLSPEGRGVNPGAPSSVSRLCCFPGFPCNSHHSTPQAEAAGPESENGPSFQPCPNDAAIRFQPRHLQLFHVKHIHVHRQRNQLFLRRFAFHGHPASFGR